MEMLIKKIKKYAKDRGIKALIVKINERINYKKDTLIYMKTHRLTERELERQRSENYQKPVIISICVPVYNTDKKQFEDMINSVLNQTYPYFELCIADGSTKVYKYIEDIVKKINDKRIKYKKLSINKGIVENSNESCAMAEGEYIALLDHDDVLSPDALYRVIKEIDKGADYIYSDEASFSKNINKPDIIHFKPDYSIFNLRGNNYICHLSVFKKSLFDKVGGFRLGFDGSQDHDLILRICEIANKIVHIPRVLYYWRVHPNSVAMDISVKPYCLTTGVKAVESHLERMNINAQVTNAVSDSAVYRVDYNLHIKPVVINSIDNIGGVSAEYIVVIDKAMKINHNTVTELAKYIQLENVAAVCGMVVNEGRIQCGGINIDKKAYEYANISILSEGYMKRLKYAHSVDAVPPYIFAVKKSVFDAMYGFDENLLRCERLIDLCVKMKKAGYEILFNPYAIAYGSVDKLSISESFYKKIKE
jgi:hypothetical protein